MGNLGKDISLQVNVCWQCGDIGISEALFYCIMCKNAARHSYCFDELPEDFTAEIDWLCEDCRSKPTPTSLEILDHGSGTPVLGQKNPCQETGSANDHFINSLDQHPVSDVRIGSSVNSDNRISHDLEKDFSCAIDGALGVISSSACFKQNDDVIEEFGNEHSKKERLMLSDKVKLDDSQPPVEAQDTNIQFEAKGLADIFIEASNEQIIGGTSTCDIGGLDAGRSSVCFGLKEDERDESEKESPEKRGLILPVKDELNSFQPLKDGDGTNFSLAIEGIPDTSFDPHDSQILGRTARCTAHESRAVGSSACYKQEEEEIELYEKRKLKSRKLILHTYELNADKAKDGPLVEMCFGAGCDTSSSPKERAIFTTELIVHPTGDKKTAASEVSVTVSDVPVVSVVPALPSIFEIGFSSSIHPMTKAQKRKMGRRFRRKNLKARMMAKESIKSAEVVKTEERYTISPTSPLLGGSRFQGTSSSFVAKKLSGTPVKQSNRHTIERTLINDTNTLDAKRSSACFMQKENEIEEHEKGDPKRISTVPCKDRLDSFHPVIDGHGTNISFAVERLVCASIEPSDNKTSMKTLGCGTNASGAVGSSTCVELKGGQIEEQKVMPMVRMIMPGMDQLDDICSPIEGQGSSFRLAAKRLSGTSIGESGKQTIGSTSRCSNDSLGKVRSSACIKLEEGEIIEQVGTRRRRSRSSRRTLIPPVKGERENFHPVVLCQGNNMQIVAKTVPVIPVKAFDKQIISRIKTSDTSGEIRSSVCFELKKGEMDRYRNDKLESRSLILPTKDELNNLHAVIDRRDTNMKLVATNLPCTSVVPSENHTRWVDTEVQIKFPWQPASHSLPLVFHIWRGCFNINKIEIGPLRAHLSTGACLKVCNLARKLPLVLHMQKLPRLVGWPNSFKVSSPTDDNIALYFFPESDRVETVLNELVDDLINKDLMLRFEFDEVELLVFSSFVLTHEHQRIFGKYYPWGVFKPRSSKIFSLPAGSHTEYQAGDLLTHSSYDPYQPSKPDFP